MKVFIICLVLVVSVLVKSESPENEKFDDDSEDKSVFDKILSVNLKAARSRSGGPQPKLFEGDIVVTDSVKEMIDGRKRGAATSNRNHIWPVVNGYHQIPYVVDGGISRYTNTISGAMREWMEKVPCLKFVRRTNQRGYLHFRSGSGCSSAVGRQGYRQYVSLATRGCMHHGIVVHEIGHALGFWHEQSRADRDKYIRIYSENIIPNMRYNFNKMSNTDERGVGYDYNSIMHYGPYAFSRNRKVTIAALGGQKIGQRQGLSEKDVAQAKKMYTACSGGGGSTGGGTTGGGGGNSACPTDKNSSCEKWSGEGYCNSSKHRSYMMSDCKKACCADNQHTRCQEWANRGECRKNPRYMLKNCKTACNKCSC